MSPDKNNKNYKVCSVCGKTSPGDSEYCQYCGKKITAAGQGQVLPAPAAEKESFLSDEKTGDILQKAVTAVCIILSLLLGFCVYKIDSLNTTVELYENRYENAENKTDSYQRKYNEIIDFLKSSDAGYASPDYYASDSIVVLNKNGESKSVTVTCRHYNTTVYYDNPDTSVVSADWSKKWNGNSLDISFTREKSGTSIIKFTNSSGSESFRIMVIVV